MYDDMNPELHSSDTIELILTQESFCLDEATLVLYESRDEFDNIENKEEPKKMEGGTSLKKTSRTNDDGKQLKINQSTVFQKNDVFAIPDESHSLFYRSKNGSLVLNGTGFSKKNLQKNNITKENDEMSMEEKNKLHQNEQYPALRSMQEKTTKKRRNENKILARRALASKKKSDIQNNDNEVQDELGNFQSSNTGYASNAELKAILEDQEKNDGINFNQFNSRNCGDKNQINVEHEIYALNLNSKLKTRTDQLLSYKSELKKLTDEHKVLAEESFGTIKELTEKNKCLQDDYNKMKEKKDKDIEKLTKLHLRQTEKLNIEMTEQKNDHALILSVTTHECGILRENNQKLKTWLKDSLNQLSVHTNELNEITTEYLEIKNENEMFRERERKYSSINFLLHRIFSIIMNQITFESSLDKICFSNILVLIWMSCGNFIQFKNKGSELIIK